MFKIGKSQSFYFVDGKTKPGADWKKMMQGYFLHETHCTLKLGVLEDESGQIIPTSAEVTPNGGLVRESPPKSP